MSLPDQVGPTERIGATSPIGEDRRSSSGTGSNFASHMGKEPQAAGQKGAPSPMELAQGKVIQTGPTMQTVMAQAQAAQSTLGDLSNYFNTPKLKLKPSQKYLLKNKLSDAVGYLRSANGKLGGTNEEDPEEHKSVGPFGRFLGYVTSGQRQLESAQNKLKELQESGDNLNPADLLLVQVKLNKASQELEYASVLLSTAVNSIKQIFNVQL